MLRSPLPWATLTLVALAACSDTQSPTDTSSPPSTTSGTMLPVLQGVHVSPASANGRFDIDLRFVNTPTAAQQQAFDVAADRWESIILGDVPDVSGQIPARSCGNSFRTPSLQGPFDDVVIHVLLQPIDGPGAVLGAAGPCLIRTADALTLYGIMFFDTDDLAFLQQNNILDEVIVHEMGHVLGIGSLWDVGRDLLQGTTADPRFVGPNAITAFHDINGKGATIPVEDQGGAGTRGSHWDEETFDTELMTGFIALGDSPLSVMTIGSMQDLGYVVSYAPADKYLVRGRQERQDEGTTTASVRINLAERERLVRPLAAVE